MRSGSTNGKIKSAGSRYQLPNKSESPELDGRDGSHPIDGAWCPGPLVGIGIFAAWELLPAV